MTITPADLRCTYPALSVKTQVLAAGITLTFLDAEGEYLGTWTVRDGLVYHGPAEVGTASTANQAADVLIALAHPMSTGSKHTPRKAPKTPVQATARTARTTTPKESTMTTTTLKSTNARIDALEGTLARIEALLTAGAPARTPKAAPAKAHRTKAEAVAERTYGGKVARCTAKTAAGKRCKREGLNGLCGSHKTAAPVKAATKAPKAQPAPKASKGTKAVAGGSGLSRSAWNKTLTTKARLAGKVVPNGASVYSLVTSPNGWAKVQQMRAEGATPDQVLAAFVGLARD